MELVTQNQLAKESYATLLKLLFTGNLRASKKQRKQELKSLQLLKKVDKSLQSQQAQ